MLPPDQLRLPARPDRAIRMILSRQAAAGPSANYELRLARLQPSLDVAVVQMHYGLTGIDAAMTSGGTIGRPQWLKRLSGWFCGRRASTSVAAS
jgi:hypothetical protein